MQLVSPQEPRNEDGLYWGYTVRIATGFHALFTECPFAGGYDLKIGTSEHGEKVKPHCTAAQYELTD